MMEYTILDFVYMADGEARMNELASKGWRFRFMTDTPGRAYIVMERETRPAPLGMADAAAEVKLAKGDS